MPRQAEFALEWNLAFARLAGKLRVPELLSPPIVRRVEECIPLSLSVNKSSKYHKDQVSL